jgi:hypothetical protein
MNISAAPASGWHVPGEKLSRVGHLQVRWAGSGRPCGQRMGWRARGAAPMIGDEVPNRPVCVPYFTANASSVPGRTQTAVLASVADAKPMVPVPKSFVTNLSPIFAGREHQRAQGTASGLTRPSRLENRAMELHQSGIASERTRRQVAIGTVQRISRALSYAEGYSRRVADDTCDSVAYQVEIAQPAEGRGRGLRRRLAQPRSGDGRRATRGLRPDQRGTRRRQAFASAHS